MDQFHSFNPNYHKIIICDEWSFKGIEYNQLNKLFDVDVPSAINCRFRPAELPPVPRVFVVNCDKPEDAFDSSITNNEVVWNAVKSRFFPFQFKDSVFIEADTTKRFFTPIYDGKEFPLVIGQYRGHVVFGDVTNTSTTT